MLDYHIYYELTSLEYRNLFYYCRNYYNLYVSNLYSELKMYNPMFFLYGAIALALSWFLLKIFLSYKDTHRIYQQKGDLESQAQYILSKQESSVSMTLQEKLDLSWQFLYDITNAIVSKFSELDKKSILEIGKVLFKHGMKYQHVVDYGIRQTDLNTKTKKNTKAKSI